MKRQILLTLLIALASSLNFAGAILLNVVWKIDLLLYMPLAFMMSFLMGVILVNMGRSLISACVSLFLSSAIVTAVMTLPPVIIGEGASVIDEALMSTLNAVSRILLFNLVVCILGALVGSLVGELLEPFEEIEI